jgi:hypothetical protein
MVLAAVLHRRGRLGTLLTDLRVYAALAAVLAVVVLQVSHSALQQTRQFMYGTGFSEVKLEPMWRYPFYDPSFYIREASWTDNSFLPLLALVGAGVLALRRGVGRPMRAVLLICVVPCFLMASLLSVFAARYSYHFIPLVILLAAAVLVTASRGLYRLAGPAAPAPWRRYAAAVCTGSVLLVAALASGLTVLPRLLAPFQGEPAQLGQYTPPHFDTAVDYLRGRWQPGDVVLAVQPEVIDHLVRQDGRGFPPGWTTDYWVESTMQLQAILDNNRPDPLHRFSGTVLLPSLEALEEVFARNQRIWYICDPMFDLKTNNSLVADFIRENMVVVQEDFTSALLLRDGVSRPAWKRQEDARALRSSKAGFRP